MSTEAVLDLLIAGRARVEAGWIQGDFARKVNGQECVCALGGIHLDGWGLRPYRLARSRLMDAIPKDFYTDDVGGHPVSDYNDHPDATQADVLALYDRAIEAERASLAVNA